MGQFVHIYTLSSAYRPFGVSAIVGGWDSESDSKVDGEVGVGPAVGAGGKQKDLKKGGPFLYMIEPSGSFWVSFTIVIHDDKLN
jgi:20S proteasome subunit alpha 7